MGGANDPTPEVNAGACMPGELACEHRACTLLSLRTGREGRPGQHCEGVSASNTPSNASPNLKKDPGGLLRKSNTREEVASVDRQLKSEGAWAIAALTSLGTSAAGGC